MKRRIKEVFPKELRMAYANLIFDNDFLDICDDYTDFLMKCMLREIEAYYNYSAILWEEIGVGMKKALMIPNLKEYNNKINILNRNDIHFACVPWNKDRLNNAIENVKVNGYNRPKMATKCQAILYKELKLCVISSVHHHMSAAWYVDCINNIEAEVYEISLSEIFNKYDISYELEWIDEDGKKIQDYIPDPRFAVLYILAKRKWQKNKTK